MGMLKNFDFDDARLRLRPGDRLLFITEGAPEAADAADQLYGEKRLMEDLAGQRGRSGDETLKAVMQKLRDWAGSEVMEDDVTLLLVDVNDDQPAGA